MMNTISKERFLLDGMKVSSNCKTVGNKTSHNDSEGNVYDFAFGLNWKGSIQDERNNKYRKTN